MIPSDTARLAVLIDADNTSAKQVGVLLEEVARYGVPTVKRAYGDWTTKQLSGWKDELNRNAIQPVQQFGYTTGKNSTDSALIIDAMDLLYSGNLDAFALVSSDSDFTRLVTRLRESGKTVYGFGRRRTPASLVAACDKFVFLEVLSRGGEPASVAVVEPGGDAAPLADLRRILTLAIEEKSSDDGWANLGAVGQYLGTLDTSFDPRNYGFSKLVALARAQDYVEVKQGGGGTPMVRLTESAPAEKPAVKKTTRQRSSRSGATKKA